VKLNGNILIFTQINEFHSMTVWDIKKICISHLSHIFLCYAGNTGEGKDLPSFSSYTVLLLNVNTCAAAVCFEGQSN